MNCVPSRTVGRLRIRTRAEATRFAVEHGLVRGVEPLRN
jgi:hypothetical protein